MTSQCGKLPPSGSGMRLCVEFPWLDLGAWLRAYFFQKLYAAEDTQLICVFEDEAQASEFFALMGCYGDTFSPYRKRIYALLAGKIGRRDALFTYRDKDSLPYPLASPSPGIELG